MENKNIKIRGYVMFWVGFVMILVSAVGYIFNVGIKSPAISVLGIVFIAVGMATIRKK